MDDYAGRVLADRYRLPLPPSDEYELAETRAFDTYSGQEVLVRQVPLPEIVEAEVLGDEAYGDGDLSDVLPGGLPEGFRSARGSAARGGARRAGSRATRRPSDPAVLRAIEAAQAAARIPDHPRLDQVFDVFAEDGSLWIVSELVAARPLAALLADRPLNPFRAAEVAADVVTALRVLHAHGWVHRNITARTVLVCDDGRVMLTGLAAGAAEEALCGYDPRPEEDDFAGFTEPEGAVPEPVGGAGYAALEAAGADGDGEYAGYDESAEYAGYDEHVEHDEHGQEPAYGGGDGYDRGDEYGGEPAYDGGPAYGEGPAQGGAAAYGEHGAYGDNGSHREHGGNGSRGQAAIEAARQADDGGAEPPYGSAERDLRAARAGAIAAYRAGAARAAARVSERGAAGRAEADGGAERGDGAYETYGGEGADGDGGSVGAGGSVGHISDPYGVRERQKKPWHGAVPRAGAVPAQGGAPGPHNAPGSHGAPDAHHAPGPHGAPAPHRTPGAPAPHRAPGAQGGAQSPPPHPFTKQLPSAQLPSARTQPAPDRQAPARPAPYPSAPHASAPRESTPYPSAPHASAPRQSTPYAPTPYQPRQNLPAPAARPAPDLAKSPDRRGTTGAPEGNARPREGEWDDPAGELRARRGPTTALAAERARHARMTVVGAVTERWAPEQAGPVHDNWQLAAPIGPATDLWALGALLFRAVQGHAPYPEDSTAELVQLVCAEPPAFAEECGPLRPVVESLLRQDPTERIDFEELSGWLRSLVRSAPEPDAGVHVVPAPPYDGGKLPVVRRRGEVVRKRRSPAPVPAGDDGGQGHGRHKRGRERVKERGRDTRPVRAPRPERAPSARGPRSLGRVLLVVILAGLVAAVAYAMLFMPESGEGEGTGRTGNAGEVSPAPDGNGERPSGGEAPDDDGKGTGDGDDGKASDPAKTPGSQEPQTTDPDLASGFTLRKDAEGFRVAVADGWDRQPKNGRGQVVYSHGRFELLVVPGRDSTGDFGTDPMKYQKEDERELQPFRDSSWATSSGLRLVDVGGKSRAEGQFTWQDTDGTEVFVRNLAMAVDGKYHVLQVRGPEAERDEVTRLFEQASTSYRPSG
ncbi:serine/threonine protein kinase [Streptomyces alboflavus]|uniref:Serine/threonine protein kinase n=2 Tax=Streptomyces TaxID=1883 RepID=A0A1Z1WH98_9ACTN|nr:protein kinase [Streptomyces alboflavus]ARX85825.1 serine/threonine protein kinase [Streptomyces alboflavus]